MSLRIPTAQRTLVTSGQAWLGLIPRHWSTKRIKFQFSCVGGGTPSKDEASYWAGTIPWASPKDFAGPDLLDTEDHITEEAVKASATRVVAPGSLLMVVRSGVLRHTIPVAINRVATALNQDLKALVPRTPLLPEYLKYLIVGKNDQLLSHWSQLGCTVESLDTVRVLNTEVPVPPQEEQIAIVNFLDRETARIDALIDKKRQLIELLQEKRAAVITRAVTRGVDEGVQLSESGVPWLGRVPKHWVVKRIKMVTPVRRGASPRPIDDPIYFDAEGEHAWVRISDVTASDMYLHQTDQRLSALGSARSVKLAPGALFLSIAATVGKPIITCIKCCIHDGFVYFPRLKESARFLYYIFASGAPYAGLGKLGTQLNLNTDTVADIAIGWPPIGEQERIADFLDVATRAIDLLRHRVLRAIDLLLEQRAAVISAAVTGHIDVREAA